MVSLGSIDRDGPKEDFLTTGSARNQDAREGQKRPDLIQCLLVYVTLAIAMRCADVFKRMQGGCVPHACMCVKN